MTLFSYFTTVLYTQGAESQQILNFLDKNYKNIKLHLTFFNTGPLIILGSTFFLMDGSVGMRLKMESSAPFLVWCDPFEGLEVES